MVHFSAGGVTLYSLIFIKKGINRFEQMLATKLNAQGIASRLDRLWKWEARAIHGPTGFIGADSARNSSAKLSPEVSQFRIRLRIRVHAFAVELVPSPGRVTRVEVFRDGFEVPPTINNGGDHNGW